MGNMQKSAGKEQEEYQESLREVKLQKSVVSASDEASLEQAGEVSSKQLETENH